MSCKNNLNWEVSIWAGGKSANSIRIWNGSLCEWIPRLQSISGGSPFFNTSIWFWKEGLTEIRSCYSSDVRKSCSEKPSDMQEKQREKNHSHMTGQSRYVIAQHFLHSIGVTQLAYSFSSLCLCLGPCLNDVITPFEVLRMRYHGGNQVNFFVGLFLHTSS